MEPFYLLEYLKNNSTLTPAKYDNLRYELDKHLHYYGEHFKYPHETDISRLQLILHNYLKLIYSLYKLSVNRNTSLRENLVISNAYFSVNDELERLGYNVVYPDWQISPGKKIMGNIDIFMRSEKIRRKFRDSNFIDLLQEDFSMEINQFEEKLLDFFRRINIRALFVPNDVGFFENLSIQVFRKLNIPSFIFLHGLPGRYNHIDENRSDYLIVWGEKIRNNYVNAGFDPDKIFVSGHPYYKQLNKSKLKFSLENILVLTKPIVGAHHSDGVILGDRSNLILYLYSVEKVLRNLNVKSVRLRPHPSENDTWYLKFIDSSFFKIDPYDLQKSILKSTLVIGPTSTLFLESSFYGANYLIYEPSISNIDILNGRLVPPFDGSDPLIPVAKSESDLEYMLKNKKGIDPSSLEGYISVPFNISFVKELI